MIRTLLIFAASGFSVIASAGQRLGDLRIGQNADADQIQHLCNQVFQQALADREEYENQPGVNLRCAFNMNRKAMTELKLGFMSRCEVFAREKSGSIVASAKVQELFGDAYGTIFRRDCLDRAVSQYHSAKASATQSSMSGGGGARAQREGCYAFHGCR